MYVSINWIKDLLNFDNISLKNLKEKLTSTGFEIESTNKFKSFKKSDIILDLSVTTNRPDILSIVGLSYEISSLMNFKFKKILLKKRNFNFLENIIERKNFNKKKDFHGTIAYFGFTISNFTYKKIQPWIQRRLLSLNIISQNNLNDLTYYLMLEWGQPIFVYDFDKIKLVTKNENPKIVIKFAKKGEVFIDSNLIKYTLTNETLIIVADTITIGIAGSLISKDICIDSNTKTIFIEASIFESKVFRRSERSIGVRTDASIFYERGINKFLIKPSLNRFLLLLYSNSNLNFLDISCNVKYFSDQIIQTKIISLSIKTISMVLDCKNSNSNIFQKYKINEYLNILNFKFLEENDCFNVLIPFTRFSDLEEEIDLIEEISRFIGFNNFNSILPEIKNKGNISKYENVKRKYRDSFLNLGFIEVFNYCFNKKTEYNIEILNPLTPDYSCLRTTLLPQLLDCYEKNISKGNKIYPIFEIGRTFNQLNSSKFLENEIISGIFGSSNYKISWDEKNWELNLFQAKGFLESIFIKLGLEISFEENNGKSKFYHNKCYETIIFKNQEIGLFGKIHPKISDQRKLSKNTFLFELDFKKLVKLKKVKKHILYKSYSQYPSLSVDLSILVPKQTNYKDIELIIKKVDNNLIETIELFDFYDKLNLSKDFFSLGLKLSFRSSNKTLMKNEINYILLEIKKQLGLELNISIRD